MNSSPELPLLFLLNQLVLAVILLHASALVSKKVEIPQLDLKTAKKLTPVTLVNVIGLVFNILCLRGVEASFFQVRPTLRCSAIVRAQPIGHSDRLRAVWSCHSLSSLLP